MAVWELIYDQIARHSFSKLEVASLKETAAKQGQGRIDPQQILNDLGV